MVSTIDLAAALLVTAVALAVGVAFLISAWRLGRRRTFERLEREPGLPLLGKAPLEAVYAAALPLGRGLASLGISANAVTLSSVVIAAVAGVHFATGHFGLGAAFAIVASLADALDGIIARETNTVSGLGRILDTVVDRYVEALLLGGIAFFVRADALLLLVTMAALVGGFMVSYASSLLRELGAADRGAPMRRAHRLAYLLGGAVAVPFVAAAFPAASLRVHTAPLMAALAAIAVVGNVSAVRRLVLGVRAQAPAEAQVHAQAQAQVPPRSVGAAARVGRGAASGGIDSAFASKSVTHP